MTIARELAGHAAALTFDDLPREVVREVKRAVLDTLACAIGGAGADAGRIARRVFTCMKGRRESTVIGSTTAIPCAGAALVNGVMTRYLDYNDTYAVARGDSISGFHPNELVPAALAVGERQHSSGRDVITAIALGYEVGSRLSDAERTPLGSLGWHFSTTVGFVTPLVAGKLLKLDQEQLVNAVGIAGTCAPTLGIIDATGEEYNMTKNLGVPHVAFNGVAAALLAQQGFTGPATVIEGKKGLVAAVTRGDFDPKALTGGLGGCSRVLRVDRKLLAADHTTQGVLHAILKLVKEHDIRPEEVESVSLQVTSRSAEHCGDPVKRYPANKETADHSLYYLAAIAMIDRAVGPRQFSPVKFTDPRTVDLIGRVKVSADPALNEFIYAGIATIRTRDGRELTCRVEYPRGHHKNPVTDSELEDKFRDAASDYLSERQVSRVVSTCAGLETVADIGELMKPFAFRCA